MEKIILNLHIISSFIPSILTILILYRCIIGLIKKKEISEIDTKLPLFVVIFLYIQLFLGGALYIIHIDEYKVIESASQAALVINLRFWALEHFIMMFFALILSHLAYIYSRSLRNKISFYKKNLIYFGMIFILIFSSLAINGLRYSGIWNI